MSEPTQETALPSRNEEEYESETVVFDETEASLDGSITSASSADEEEEDESIPEHMGPDDPLRMKLTREELLWAMYIKDAIEASPDVDNLSDFMYCQFAVMCKEDTENAVQRAHALQSFRQEYSILDTYEDGCRAIRAMVDLFPEEFLSFSYSHQESTYVLIHDTSKFDMTALTTPQKVNDFFAGAYYMHTAMCPDMATIRSGMLVLIECSQFDFSKKPNLKLIRQLFSDLLAIYPFHGHARFYHTGTFINIMVSMLRSVLPAELKDRMQTGLTAASPLNEIFLVPTVEEATERVIHRIEDTLKRRYQHQSSFSLAPQQGGSDTTASRCSSYQY